MSAAVQKTEPVLEERWQQMTLDEAISVAHRETGVSYQKDDPVLAMVAILNAFGEKLKVLMDDERQRMSQQFNSDVAGVNSAIDHKVEDVAATLQSLAGSLGNESVQTVVAAVAQHSVEGNRIRRAIRRNFIACSVFAATNWLAVAALYLLLK